MLNILKGVKFAQDDSTGDVYAIPYTESDNSAGGKAVAIAGA